MYVQSIFLRNRNVGGTWNYEHNRKIGDSHIRLGDDDTEYSTSNTIIVASVTDGGFWEASSLISGRYLTIRRDVTSSIPDVNYNLREIKLY